MRERYRLELLASVVEMEYKRTRDPWYLRVATAIYKRLGREEKK